MQPLVYHIPALLLESINGLAIKPEGTYVDATFGGGGHSRAILEHLGEKGRLIGMDQDMDAWQNRLEDDRFTFAHGNFAYIKNFLRYYGVDSVDGILADLGVSFHHFDAVDRGFTFRADAPTVKNAWPMCCISMASCASHDVLLPRLSRLVRW